MADTNLRNYLKKVETLIERSAFDEAIAHSRHIIQHFPRNVQAYRLLGQALVSQARWEEAGDVLRRVLSVFPLDFMANEHLSLAYEKLKQPEAALWHLERAFDQQPNDRNVVTRLRELYAEYKGVQLERIQLTAGAVASQYLSGNMPGQAIEVLNKALERFPDRVDLRLMLARALWSVGQAYDSAEVAVEVLNELPYALSANRIMTELWLREQRPSDAQRFLSRVEEVDPYLAFKLATGEGNPPAEAVAISELDYQAYVRQALAAQSPDWLTAVSDPSVSSDTESPESVVDDDADWLNLLDEEGAQAGTAPLSQVITDQLDKMLPDDTAQKLRAQKGGTDQLEGGLPKEILARIDAMRGVSADQTVASPPPQPDALLDMLDTDVDTGDLNDSWMKDLGIETVDEPVPPVHTGRTGMLASLEEEIELSDDQDDSWLQELGDFDTGSPAPAAAKPTASSERVSTGLTGMLDELGEDAPNLFDDILDTDEPPQSPPATSPARNSTGFTGMLDDIGEDTLAEFEDKALMAEFDFEAGPPVPAKSTHESTGLTDMLSELSDDDSSLEWLDEHELAMPHTETGAASDAANPLAWMQDTGIEIDQSAPSRRLNEDLFSDVADSSDLTNVNDNPNAWLAASGIEFESDEPEDASLPDSSDLSGSDEDPMGWMKASGIEIEADDAAEAPTLAVPPPARPAASSANDWMSDESMLDEMLQLESLTDDESAFDESLDAVSMADMAANDADAQAPESPVDWQNTMPDTPPTWQDDEPESDEFDSMAWLNDSDEPAADAAPQPEAEDDEQADALAWLSEEKLAAEAAVSDEAALDDFEADPNTLDWLNENEVAMDSLSAGDEADETAEPAEAGSFSFFDEADDDGMVISDAPSDEPVEETSFAWDAMAEEDAAAEEDLPAETAPQGEYMWSDESGDLEGDALDEPIAEGDSFAWNAALSDAEGTDDEGNLLAAEEEAGSDSFEWGVAEDGEMLESPAEEEEPAATAETGSFTWATSDEEEALPDAALPEEPIAEGDTGWMSDLSAASTESDLNWTDEDAAPQEEPVAEESSFAWDDDEETMGLEPAAEEDSLVWGAELDTEGETASGEPAYADAVMDDIDEERTLDWMVEAGVELNEPVDENAEEDDFVWDDYEDAQPSATAGMTGLLNNLESNRYTSSLDESAEEAAAPDWLGSVEPADESDVDWMAEEDQPAEEQFDVVSAAGIQWDADEFADDELGDADGEGFQWDEEFVDETGEEAAYATAASDETGSNWLSDLAPQASEPEAEFNWGDEAVASDATPEWLTMLDAEPEADAMPQSASEVLSGMDDEMAEPEAEGGWTAEDMDFEQVPMTDAEGDWLASEENMDEDFAFAAAANNTSEENWLTDDENADEGFEFAAESEEDWMPVADEADSDQAMEFAPAMSSDEEFLGFDDADADENALPYDDEEPVASDSFEWSADLDEAPAEPVYAQVGSLEQAHEVTQAELDAEFADEFNADLAEFSEEEVTMEPAANAPDWLNAMVPGLDIDYEAEEDYGGTGVKTPEPVEAAPARAARTDFSWLNTIVEEESANLAPAAPAAPPPPPGLPEPGIAATARRFVFKQLPAWMRGSRSNGDTATVKASTGSSTGAVATPDYLDFDEFDKTQPTPAPAPASSANMKLADELTALPDDEFEDTFDDDFSTDYDDDFVDDDFDFDMDDLDDTDTRR